MIALVNLARSHAFSHSCSATGYKQHRKRKSTCNRRSRSETVTGAFAMLCAFMPLANTVEKQNKTFVYLPHCASRKGFKVPLNFPVQASVPPLSGVFQQCIARRTKRLAPCPMHAPTIPAHHEGNGFDLLFLVQVLKSFLFYTQLVYSNRLVEEKAGHLYAVCLLPDAKARRRAGLTAPARARCRPVPSARC